jgi:hypothetical protein
MTATIQNQILIRLDQTAHKVNQFASNTKEAFDHLRIMYNQESPTIERIKSIAHNLIQTVRDQVLSETNWNKHNFFFSESGRICCQVYKFTNGEIEVELFTKLNKTSWY